MFVSLLCKGQIAGFPVKLGRLIKRARAQKEGRRNSSSLLPWEVGSKARPDFLFHPFFGHGPNVCFFFPAPRGPTVAASVGVCNCPSVIVPLCSPRSSKPLRPVDREVASSRHGRRIGGMTGKNESRCFLLARSTCAGLLVPSTVFCRQALLG